MAKIRFENGTVVNFEGTPTPQDVEEIAQKLNIKKTPTTPPVKQKTTFAQNPFINTAVQLGGGIERAGMNLAKGAVGLVDKFAKASSDPTNKVAQSPVARILFGPNSADERAISTNKVRAKIAPVIDNLNRYQENIAQPLLNEKKSKVGEILGDTIPYIAGEGPIGAISKGAEAYTAGKIASPFIKTLVKRGTSAVVGGAGDAAIAASMGDNAKDMGLTSGAGRLVLPYLFGKNQSLIKGVKNQFSVDKHIGKLEDYYIKNTGGTKSGKKFLEKLQGKTQMLNKAGTTGETAERVLAQNGIVPNIKGTMFDTAQQVTDFRAKTKPLNELMQSALKEVEQQTPPINLEAEKVKAIAKANIEENINSGVSTGLVNSITKEYDNLIAQHGNEIPITLYDRIKSARWDKAFKNKAIVESDKLIKDADYLIGNTAKNTIQDVAIKSGLEEVGQFNREIGDIHNAAQLLEKMNGNTIKGGRLGKYVGSIIGSTFGNTIPGKIIGAVGGSFIAEALMKAQAGSPLTRFVLRKLETENPKAYKEVVKWLAEQGKARSTRLALPSSGEKIINEGRPIRVNAQKNTDYIGKDLSINTGGNTFLTPKASTKNIKTQTKFAEKIKNANILKQEALDAKKPLPSIDFGKKLKIKSDIPKVSHETAPNVITPKKISIAEKIKNAKAKKISIAEKIKNALKDQSGFVKIGDKSPVPKIAAVSAAGTAVLAKLSTNKKDSEEPAPIRKTYEIPQPLNHSKEKLHVLETLADNDTENELLQGLLKRETLSSDKETFDESLTKPQKNKNKETGEVTYDEGLMQHNSPKITDKSIPPSKRTYEGAQKDINDEFVKREGRNYDVYNINDNAKATKYYIEKLRKDFIRENDGVEPRIQDLWYIYHRGASRFYKQGKDLKAQQKVVDSDTYINPKQNNG